MTVTNLSTIVATDWELAILLNSKMTARGLKKQYSAEYFANEYMLEIKYDQMYMAIFDTERKFCFFMAANRVHKANIKNALDEIFTNIVYHE